MEKQNKTVQSLNLYLILNLKSILNFKLLLNAIDFCPLAGGKIRKKRLTAEPNLGHSHDFPAITSV